MTAIISIEQELPPLPVVFDLKVEHALGTINQFRDYIQSDETRNNLQAYEYKAAEVLSVYEAIVNKLVIWGGDMISLPDADNLIKSVCTFIDSLELMMSAKKVYIQ